MSDEGRVIVVTGGASGIGRATSELIAKGGDLVVLADIDRDRGDKGAEEIGKAASFVDLDVTSEESWQQLFRDVVDVHGRIDGLVNAAGIAGGDMDNLLDCDDELWSRVQAVNLESVFLGCKHFILTARSLQPAPRAIVNISSILAIVGDGGSIAYCASKDGVRMLTKSVALHTAAEKLSIRCNSVHPGFVDTPMIRDWAEQVAVARATTSEEVLGAVRELHPIGRLARPEEVGAAIVFLLAEEASFITGAQLPIDGGYTSV